MEAATRTSKSKERAFEIEICISQGQMPFNLCLTFEHFSC